MFVLLSGVTAGVFYPLSQRDCDCRSVTNPSSVCSAPPPLQPRLPRYFACGPLPSFNLHCIWVWSAGNLLCPIRSSCQLGFPFILAHLLSVPLRWPRPLSLSLMPIIMPALTDAPSLALGLKRPLTYTTHPRCCICTHTEPDGCTGGCPPLPDAMFDLSHVWPRQRDEENTTSGDYGNEGLQD